ncbi:MAG: DUF748 domain-containing protein [Candidatus Scalindua sp.]|nr:DUF748 domain-containing protein [Candidatus Scalindua sp.]
MGIGEFYHKLPAAMKYVTIAAAIFLLYTITGLLIAPSIVRSKLISGLTETFGRNVVIEQVRINPFALSLTVGDFEMSELNGERFFHFDELYVNFQFSSLFRRAFTFAQIRLVRPDGKVQILPDGKFNFSDLIASLGTSGSLTEKNSALPPVIISRLQIERGRLEYSDLSHPTPFEVKLSPVKILLESFSTRENSAGRYLVRAKTSKGGELYCEGDISVNPLGSHGKLTLSKVQTSTLWEYIQDQVGFIVSDGYLDMDAGYSVGLSGGGIDLKLVDGNMKLGGLELVEKENTGELLSIPSLSVKGIDIDFSQKEAVIGKVYTMDLKFHDRLDKDGIMHSQKLFIPDSVRERDEGDFTRLTSAAGEGKTWRFTVHEVNVEDSRIRMQNHTLPEIQKLNLDPVTVNLKNLSNEKDSKMELSIDLGLNETGTIHLAGEAGMDPVFAVAHAKATRLPLSSFQPTLNAFTKITIVGGTLDLDGSVNYMSLGSEGPLVRYEGDAKIESLRISDQIFSEELLKWESLSLSGISCNVIPYGINISEVVASKPYAKVIIWQDGTINLSTVLAMSDSRKGQEKLFLSRVLPAEDDRKSDGDSLVAEGSSTFDLSPFPINIDEIRIENGSADFTDLTLKPNFVIHMEGLNGIVKGVTSESGTRADVVLKGEVDEHAPVTIAGKINLLSAQKYADLSLIFKNMELTTATPYSAKFAGYPIEKGKISLNLKYKLSENLLIGENVIRVDQLTLGDRIDSKDATKLPVKLAIALLKDRQGRIDLDLPIRGELNDPEFNYGSVILKAFVGLVTKIVTSPFSVLAGLVGGGDEELGSVEFKYGRSELSDREVRKLDKLAKALFERPMLMLEIRASADDKNDRKALGEWELHNRMLSEGGRTIPTGTDYSRTQDISLSDEEYGRLIITMYKRDFGHHPKKLFGDDGGPDFHRENSDKDEHPESKAGTVEPGGVVAAAKRHLIDKILIDDTMLRTLARERAKQIKNYLIVKGGVPNEQLFIIDGKINKSVNGDRIHTTLSLSTR